jgi:hypothetical protein
VILYSRIPMAQTKRKRRTKHRGNAAGAIEARGRTSRPAEGAQPRQGSRQAGAKGGRAPLKPATLKRSLIKAAGFALLLFVLTQVGVFGKNQSPGSGVILALVSFLLYTPLVFATDRWAYQRDQRRRGLAAPAGKRR